LICGTAGGPQINPSPGGVMAARQANAHSNAAQFLSLRPVLRVSFPLRPVPVASASHVLGCVHCVVKAGPQLMTRMVKCALQFPRPFTTVPVWRRHRLQRQQMQSVPKSRPSPCKRKPRLRSVSIYASAQGVRQLRYSIDPGERDYARAAIAPRRLPRPASTGLIFPMDAEETVRREWIGV
jgi:hypothetical protein